MPAFNEGDTIPIHRGKSAISEAAQNCDGQCEDVAIITAFFDYITKLEKIQPQAITKDLGNNWKDFGRKRSILRL